METIYEQGDDRDHSRPELGSEALKFMGEAAKWARFLSIMGFVGIGFFILMGFAVGSIDTSEYGLPIPGGILGIIYTIMAAIGFFPVLFLYRFSKRMRKALELNDAVELKLAFMYLRSHYKFLGILSIVLIAFYFFAMIFGVGAAAMG